MSDPSQLFLLISNFASALLCLYILFIFKLMFDWLPSRKFLMGFFAIKLIVSMSFFALNLFENAWAFRAYISTLPLILLVGPLLTRFTRSTINIKKMPLLNGANILLLLSGYVCLLPFILLPFPYAPSSEGIEIWRNLSQLAFVMLFLISSSIHFLRFFVQFYQGQLYGMHFSENTYQWLKGVWLSCSLIWATVVIDFISDLFDHHPIWRDVVAFAIDLASVLIVIVYTVRYCKQSDFVATSKQFIKDTYYEKSGLSEQQAQSILRRLDKLMEQDKVFLDSELTLDKVATHCQSKTKYLTQALNQYRQTSYLEYLAHHRIEFAKQQLKQTDNSVLDIALAAGFSAKSTFNHTFKKLTKQTPTEFRKEKAA